MITAPLQARELTQAQCDRAMMSNDWRHRIANHIAMDFHHRLLAAGWEFDAGELLCTVGYTFDNGDGTIDSIVSWTFDGGPLDDAPQGWHDECDFRRVLLQRMSSDENEACDNYLLRGRDDDEGKWTQVLDLEDAIERRYSFTHIASM